MLIYKQPCGSLLANGTLPAVELSFSSKPERMIIYIFINSGAREWIIKILLRIVRLRTWGFVPSLNYICLLGISDGAATTAPTHGPDGGHAHEPAGVARNVPAVSEAQDQWHSVHT